MAAMASASDPDKVSTQQPHILIIGSPHTMLAIAAPQHAYSSHTRTRDRPMILTTAITRSDEQVARQTALSHAMGALFLESRVNQLESSLQQARSKQHHHHHHHRGPQHDLSTSASSLRIRQHGRSSSHHPASKDPVTLSDSGHAKGKGKERASHADGIRVVDVSVLIYALRNVHEWIRQGHLTILVPYSALHTLDMLKSGKELINHAARKAMSFIEKYLTDGSAFDPVQSDSTASSSSNQDRRTRPGLFIQAQDEQWSPARLGELRTRREAEEELEALINDLEADTGHPIDHDVFQLDMPEQDSDDDDEVILIQTPAAQHDRSSSEERKKVGASKKKRVGPPAVRGWRLSSRGTTPRHIRDVLSCALWAQEEAERRFPASSTSSPRAAAASDAKSKQSKKSDSRGRALAPFAFVVAYPPPALRDPRAHEDQEGATSRDGSDQGHHAAQSGVGAATTRGKNASTLGEVRVQQHLQATAPGAKMTRSGSITRSGGSHSSSRSGGAAGHTSAEKGGSAAPTTGSARFGYESLADGLLTQRWALSFGMGSAGTADSTSGGAGGRKRSADVAGVGSTILVLPTATSWIELAGSQRST
ncbi:hypothetical protein OC845_001021 [Tilletia horrida]|nr:hypothetical protein OC845_001021 [Tilletia horrida]